jgi:hypothetical protein
VLFAAVVRLDGCGRALEELCRGGLLSTLAFLLSDKTPDARASSRKIVCLVRVRCLPRVLPAARTPL